MPDRDTTEIVLIILAVIGGLALLAVLGMGLMQVTMMGWMMGGGGWFMGLLCLVLLIIAGVVAAVVLLTRRQLPP
jgi:hypothetical protein